MKGVVFLGDRKLELREFPDPTPGPRDVILEIKASGMCGSDLHNYRAPANPGGVVTGGIKRMHHVGAPGYAVAQGAFRVFELPPVTLRFAESMPNAGLSERKTPLYIGTGRTVTDNCILIDSPSNQQSINNQSTIISQHSAILGGLV